MTNKQDDIVRDDIVKRVMRYRRNPVLFAEEVLCVTLTNYQKEVLMSMVDNMLTAWHSGHSCGKTFLSSVAVMWFLFCFFQSRIVTTASVWRQVEKQLWPEIHKRVNSANLDLIGFSREFIDLQKTKLYIKDPSLMGDRTWFATGESAAEEGKMEGFHEKHILFIVDEGKLVSREMYLAIMSCLTTEHSRMLVISTPPVSASPCYFRSICEGKVPGFKVFHTSGLDSPYVEENWVKEIKRAGGGTSSALYRAKVLGEFSNALATDSVFSPNLVDNIFNAELEPSDPVVMGVDVARFGDDMSVVAVRHGPVISRIEAWQGLDLKYTASRVLDIAREEQPSAINIDVIGYGAGPMDNIAVEGAYIDGINFTSLPSDYGRFHNLRAEAYFNLQRLMEEGKVSVAQLEDESIYGEYLAADLLAQTYSYDIRDRIILTPKTKIRTSMGRSPDFSDAVVMAFIGDELTGGDGGGFIF